MREFCWSIMAVPLDQRVMKKNSDWSPLWAGTVPLHESNLVKLSIASEFHILLSLEETPYFDCYLTVLFKAYINNSRGW